MMWGEQRNGANMHCVPAKLLPQVFDASNRFRGLYDTHLCPIIACDWRAKFI